MSSTSSSEHGGFKASPEAANQGKPIQSQPQSKRRAARVSRACDFCHSRSIRCRQENNAGGGSTPGRCQSCIEYSRDCTYDRPSKKRGVKSNASRTSSATSSLTSPWVQPSISLGVDTSVAFKAPEVLDRATIANLVEIYYETIYPIFPFFHRSNLYHRLKEQEYETDPAFFAAIMAMSSLALARVRDGATFSDRWNNYDISSLPNSEELAARAHTIIPKDTRASQHHDYTRAVAFLALASLQNGAIQEMRMWMGTYSTLMRLTGFHNEDNWPETLSLIEVEERRRLFWSMYTVEIISAVCFDNLISIREAQVRVQYPRELDDDRLDDMSNAGSQASSPTSDYSGGFAQDPSCPNWLQGWNFTVDMCRVVEHAIDRRREAENVADSDRPTRLFCNPKDDSNPRETLKEVFNSFNALPNPFKEIRSITFHQPSDIFGFQAAQISATIQLVRISLLSPEVATYDECCQIVREVIQTFAEVPIGYLKALSTPLVYHLSGIGESLRPIAKRPMSDTEYHRCRDTLLGLSNLLANLGTGTLAGDAPARRVRERVHKLDKYVRAHLVATHQVTKTTQFTASVPYFHTSARPTLQIPNGTSYPVSTGPTPPNSAMSGVVSSPHSMHRNSLPFTESTNHTPHTATPQSSAKNGYTCWYSGDPNNIPSAPQHRTPASSLANPPSSNSFPASYAPYVSNGPQRTTLPGTGYGFPREMLEDCSWAFDFGQASPND